MKIIGGEITLNDEADKIEYFDVDKLPSNTSQKQVERIKDVIANPDKTIYKVQTGKSSIELIKEGKLWSIWGAIPAVLKIFLKTAGMIVCARVGQTHIDFVPRHSLKNFVWRGSACI